MKKWLFPLLLFAFSLPNSLVFAQHVVIRPIEIVSAKIELKGDKIAYSIKLKCWAPDGLLQDIQSFRVQTLVSWKTSTGLEIRNRIDDQYSGGFDLSSYAGRNTLTSGETITLPKFSASFDAENTPPKYLIVQLKNEQEEVISEKKFPI